MQTVEKVSKTISLIIFLFPHLVNALWRVRGTKSVQDIGRGGGGGIEKKMGGILNPDPFPSSF